MSKDPVVIHDESDSEIVKILQSERYQTRNPTFIPVVNDDDRPIKLYHPSELINPCTEENDDSRGFVKSIRVLLIGGGGYIGSVLTRMLLKAGYHVTILDNFLYGDDSVLDEKEHPNINIVYGDTRHIDVLAPLIRNADAVIHLAELVGDPLCAQDPETTFEINYLATAAIARTCAYLQVNRFIYVSSCSVYGASENPDDLLDERSVIAPVSLYAKTKVNAERAILGFDNGTFSPIIFRLGTVFGWSFRPRFDLVVNTLTAKAVMENEINIVGGDQWRPHVHVTDVAQTIQLALEAPIGLMRNQVFNIVGENFKIGELGHMVAELVPGTIINQKKSDMDKRNYRVSGDKARIILGFSPSVSVRDGIVEVADALKSGKVQNYQSKQYYNRALC